MDINTQEIIFSICITSYNRVGELKRLLDSVDAVKYADNTEILVSEDKSPRKDEIREVVENYAKGSRYHVKFNTNINNLGYDRNLGKLKQLARGKYIIFMSDDDSFVPNALDAYMEAICHYEDCSLAFQPFILPGNSDGYCRKYSNSYFIEPSIKNTCRHIQDAILFSGLTFKKEVIDQYDAEPFLNMYYFQVYLFMSVLYKKGGYYVNIPLVYCNGDGENGFGLSESSEKISDLADRKSVFSKLEFHKGLLKSISMFDSDNGSDCKSFFAKEYSLHTLPGICTARKFGKITFREYTQKIESLDVKLSIVYYIYKYLTSLLGPNLTLKIFSIPRRCLLYYRKNAAR